MPIKILVTRTTSCVRPLLDAFADGLTEPRYVSGLTLHKLGSTNFCKIFNLIQSTAQTGSDKREEPAFSLLKFRHTPRSVFLSSIPFRFSPFANFRIVSSIELESWEIILIIVVFTLRHLLVTRKRSVFPADLFLVRFSRPKKRN
jgi:hypothetical protein